MYDKLVSRWNVAAMELCLINNLFVLNVKYLYNLIITPSKRFLR
jgi:hypothetical protein